MNVEGLPSAMTISRPRGPSGVQGCILLGKRILLIEDDYFQAFDLRTELVNHGAEVIGPFGQYDLAVDLARSVRRIDAAILDINLHGELSFTIMDEFVRREVPAIYWTAYDDGVVPYRHQHIPLIRKPMPNDQVAQALVKLVADCTILRT